MKIFLMCMYMVVGYLELPTDTADMWKSRVSDEL